MKENLRTCLPHLDFLSGPMRYRSEHASLKKELVARAMGKRPRDNPIIIDATAGLGRDSFILATLGYHVTLLERSRVMYDHLLAALKHASTALPEIIARMQLIHADAIDWLAHLPDDKRPDVVYLDPMFPERKKSALVKKEMLIMQHLLGNDSDHALLFGAAHACAKKRVVVKRPRIAANIVENAPNFTLTAKSSRFDVYLK